jgi:D-sedoheptulose 7-phosphate isomerase
MKPSISSENTDPVDEYLVNLSASIEALSRQQIWSVLLVLYEAWQTERRIFLCGNGGSAATASHLANDLNKLTIVEGKPRMKALALTDNIPLMTAWANDSAFEDIFAEQLLNFIEPGDVLIGISTSGYSRNVLRAFEVAKAYKGITIGFTGNDGGKLKDIVDYCIFFPDNHIGRQEDGHMILDHVISNTLRRMIIENYSVNEYPR